MTFTVMFINFIKGELVMWIYETLLVKNENNKIVDGPILYLDLNEIIAIKIAEEKWNLLYDENRESTWVEVRRYTLPNYTNPRDGESIAKIIGESDTYKIIREYSYDLKNQLNAKLKSSKLSEIDLADMLAIPFHKLQNLLSGQEVISNVFEKNSILEKMNQINL